MKFDAYRSILRGFVSFIFVLMSAALISQVVFPTQVAQAAVPRVINYHSRLRTNALVPVATPISIQFSLYKSLTSGSSNDPATLSGPLVWKEIHDGVSCPKITPDADGYFSIQLGSCTAIPSTVDFTDPVYLGVKIESDAEATPRATIGAAPYALNTAALNGFTASTSANANSLLALDQNLGFNINSGAFEGGSLNLTSSTANNNVRGNLAVSGTLSFGSTQFANATSTGWLGFATASGTSLTTLNLSANNVSLLSGTAILSAATSTQFVFTNATGTNLNVATLTANNGVFTNVTSTNNLNFATASGTTLNAVTGNLASLIAANASVTNIVMTNGTSTNATTTNLFASNIIANSASFTAVLIGGQAPCLANGTNCAAVSSTTSTLQDITNQGNSTTNRLQFAGGTSTGPFLTSSLNVTTSAIIASLLTTNSSSTNSTSTNAMIANLTATVGAFTSGSFTNVTSTAFLGFATASGTNLNALNLAANSVSLLGGTAIFSAATSSQFIFTNTTGTSANITGLTATNGTFVNATSTNRLSFATATGTSLITFNLTANNSTLLGGTAAFSSSTITNIAWTSATGVNLNTTNLSVTRGSIGNLQVNTTGSAASLNVGATGTNPVMQWYDSSGNALARLTSSGSLGLGTINPSSKFQVIGTSTLRDIVPSSTGSYDLGSSFLRWDEAWINAVNLGTSTWSLTQSDNGARFSLFQQPNGTGAEAFTVLNNGNVGIGNTNPQARLHVTSQGSDASMLILDNASMASFGITAQDGSTIIDQDRNGVGNILAFSVAGTEAMRINARGNIGVGTTEPETRFQVYPRTDTDPLDGIELRSPYRLDVQGRYAYVINKEHSSLSVVDVTTPTRLQEISNTRVGDKPNAITVQGYYAYIVTSGDGTLEIYDISNPTSPSRVGRVSVNQPSPLDIVIQGRYAYISTDANIIEIFDLSDPTAPIFVSDVRTCSSPEHLAVRDRYLYTTCVRSDEVDIFELNNPTSPSQVEAYSANTPAGIVLQGRYAYILHRERREMSIVDVSEPGRSQEVGSIELNPEPVAIRVLGNVVYVVSQSGNVLELLDITDPRRPSRIGTDKLDKTPTDAVIQGRYAFTLSQGAARLQAFDLGAAYLAQVQAGGLEAGTIETRENLRIGNDLDVRGASVLGGSVQVNGTFAVNANKRGSNAAIFTIDQAGNVGIGTNVPDQLLSVNGDVSKIGGGTWQTFSDRQLKQDITGYSDGLNVITNINPVRFRYNGLGGISNTSTQYIGIVAQDIQQVAPYTVSSRNVYLRPGDDATTPVLTFDPNALTYALINSVKELASTTQMLQQGLNLSSPAPSQHLLSSSYDQGTVIEKITLGTDSAGRAIIRGGDQAMRVEFKNPFVYRPVVSLTPMDFIEGSYRVTNVTESGFLIQLSSIQPHDVMFNWTAIGSASTQVTASDDGRNPSSNTSTNEVTPSP